MPQLVAVSDVVLAAIFGVVGTVVTVLGTIVVAAIGRGVKDRQATVNRTVDDFESAWSRRGQLLDGLGQDLDAAHRRIDEGERREQLCQDRLAKLEAIVERRKRPRG